MASVANYDGKFRLVHRKDLPDDVKEDLLEDGHERIAELAQENFE